MKEVGYFLCNFVDCVCGSAASYLVGERGAEINHLLFCYVVPNWKKHLFARYGSCNDSV